MIIDGETSPSERAPLKSPAAPITTARHDSPLESAPPTYTPTGPSSAHLPHHHHHPQSPISPHPHSPHSHAYTHTHYYHDSTSAGSIHSATNLPPHIVKLIEEREIRQKALYRFFTSFAVAWLIILVWSALIRGVTLTIIHSTSANDIDVEYPSTPLDLAHSYLQWSQAYSYPEVEPQRLSPNDAKSFSLKFPVLMPQPTVSLTITPTPIAERILSIAYPPSPSPSQASR